MTEDFKDVSGLLEEDVSKVSTDEKVSVPDKIDIGDKIDIFKPIIPIKPIRAPKFAAMRSMAEYPIPTPVTRKEMFLNVIAGGISELPTPKTREELYLAKICGQDVEIPIPLTRYEMYLYALSGGEWEVPEPKTRLEIFLYHNLGFEVETPEPVTREEIYWNGGQPQPTTIEGIPPLTFIAKRTGSLEDYTIYGNSVQNGTPTPDSPVEPEFVGERTENLFDPENTEFGIIQNDGSISGVTTGLGIVSDFIDISTNSAVTLSQNRLKEQASSWYAAIGCWDSNKNFIAGSRVFVYVRSIDSPERRIVTKEFPEGTKYIRVNICVDSRSDSPTTVEPMLNWGSTALPYEPYGYKIPISSAGQTKTIYLGQVPTTRRIKKLVLTGEENFRKASNGCFYWTGGITDYSRLQNVDMCRCTHFGSQPLVGGTSSVTTNNIAFYHSTVTSEFYCAARNISSVDDFKEWLAQQYAAGTPVTVWYVLATPEVGIVNEPLAKIGDYADSVDFSQAGVEIPTTAGENTLSVGTEVQPSNMSITYK